MLDDLNLDLIQDVAGARKALVVVLNIVEEQQQQIEKLREEIQRLRDENNRLKGEQEKPNIKANKKGRDHSSEKERRARKPRPKREKRRPHSEVEIDREEKLAVPAEELPADAQFKGYEAVVVQEVSIKTDNVRFLKEKWYSPSEQRTYIASLPAGYKGQFGATVQTLVTTLYYAGGMSEPKIIEFIEPMGVTIVFGRKPAPDVREYILAIRVNFEGVRKRRKEER